MKFRFILNKIDWRIILIYLVAIWLFEEAFQTISYFSDLRFLQEVVAAKKKGLTSKEIITETNFIAFSNFYFYSAVGSIIGFLTAILISFLISIKQKGVWINSFISIVIIYSLSWLGITKSYFLKSIFFLPGIIFQNNIQLTIVINALIFLSLGTFAFYLSKRVIKLQNSKTVA